MHVPFFTMFGIVTIHYINCTQSEIGAILPQHRSFNNACVRVGFQASLTAGLVAVILSVTFYIVLQQLFTKRPNKSSSVHGSSFICDA